MVQLEPMTETQFRSYLDTAVEDYAQAHLKSGDCAPKDALRLAQEDYQELLPDGLQSKNQFLFSIHDDAPDKNEIIGMVWFAVKDGRAGRSAFIYDLGIREDLRRKGYGRKVMERVEERVREMGIGKVGLNVFGYNQAARTLYEKMGYQITGIGMIKTLGKR
jgi:ribosomal protein S18 acetylase RimI-like enzyme